MIHAHSRVDRPVFDCEQRCLIDGSEVKRKRDIENSMVYLASDINVVVVVVDGMYQCRLAASVSDSRAKSGGKPRQFPGRLSDSGYAAGLSRWT